jgi:hypothetical protein
VAPRAPSIQASAQHRPLTIVNDALPVLVQSLPKARSCHLQSIVWVAEPALVGEGRAASRVRGDLPAPPRACYAANIDHIG